MLSNGYGLTRTSNRLSHLRIKKEDAQYGAYSRRIISGVEQFKISLRSIIKEIPILKIGSINEQLLGKTRVGLPWQSSI